MLRACGPLMCVAALPPWSAAPFVVLAPGHCPGRCGAAPCVEVCGSGPCFGRYTPCVPGSWYAGAVWCLWFVLWLGRCSRCVVMGCGPVPCLVVAVLSALWSPSARGVLLCWPCRGSGRCAIGSLHGWIGVLSAVCCTPCGWGLECVCLVLVLGSYRWGCRGRWCRAAVCDCSPCFGCYTPCRPGSGYTGVMWCLRFGLWRCCQYVVMGRGLVLRPPAIVFSFAPLSPSPLGAPLCRWCWGHGPCAVGSLLPGARCTPCGWHLGCVRLVLVLGSCCLGCRGCWGRPGVVPPFESLLLSTCSA